MNDDDELSEEERSALYMSAEAQAGRDVIAKAISDYARIVRPDEDPLVVAWVVGLEWTNIDLERSGRAGRETISPHEQTLSASVGLGHHIANRYG